MRIQVVRTLRWVLIGAGVCYAPAASAQYFKNAEVIHADEATHIVLFSFWQGDSNYAEPAYLYRASVDLWNGRMPPVLREGLTFRGQIRFGCPSCEHDEFPGNGPGPWNLSVSLWREAPRVFGRDSDDGQLELHFDNVIRVGTPCKGMWEWNGANAQCVPKSAPDNPLSVAWRQWSGRDKLMLLVYLHDFHAIGTPGPASWFCSRSKSAQERHRCKPDSESEYLDPIVDVASHVDPLPALPDRAGEYLFRANSEMGSVTKREDLQQAIDHYTQAINSAPWWAEAYYNRARAEALDGLSLWAIADYEHYLKLNHSPTAAREVKARIESLKNEALGIDP